MDIAQLMLSWMPKPLPSPAPRLAEEVWITAGGESHRVEFRRMPQARRYRLYVDRDGQPRVVIPRRGTLTEARAFLARHRSWLENQLERSALQASERRWRAGSEIFFRGQPVTLGVETGANGEGVDHLLLGDRRVRPLPSVPIDPSDLRPAVEASLREWASHELPPRTRELGAQLQITVHRVTVRSQRSRWGSCSARGTISLNWRLIQVPDSVRDYIIVHELMHRREMNHSSRFWALVAATCPDFEQQEAWLKRHERALLSGRLIAPAKG